MKALIVGLALLVAVASAGMTVDLYEDDGCKGSPLHSFSPKVGTCETRHHSGRHTERTQHDASFMLTTPAMMEVAGIYRSTGTNCSTHEEAEFVPCNKCMPARETGEYFKFACNSAAKNADVSIGCDSSCTTCKHNLKWAVGECNEDKRRGSGELYFDAIFNAYAFTEMRWNTSTTCSGTPSFEHEMISGFCERRIKFEWTPSSLKL